MADLFENPIGTDGFEFVEFTSPEPEKLAAYFEQIGFTAVSKHRSKNVVRYKQNDINFILNMEPSGQAADFRSAHGPSANAMAFRVRDAKHALEEAIKRGAEPVEGKVGPMELNIPAIKGIGGAYIYLVDRYGAQSIYDIDFKPIEGADEKKNSIGLTYLDHLTHNVFRGNMKTWADYYEKIFNFREIRYFDIEGKVTGLFSKAMTSPDGKIRIPLNELKGDEGKVDQIQEYLQRYKGEGIQHLAFGTDNLYEVVDRLRARSVELQDTIEAYFDLIDKRLPGHGEPVEELRKRRILIDGAPSEGQGLLLQIFGKDAIGPIFFEFIQRKGNEGFGEGNFKALFESIELDQIRRGVLKEFCVMRALLALALIALSACGTIRGIANPEPEPERWSIVLHGGAGVIDRTTLTPAQDAAYRAAMRDALTIGGNILESGGTSLDAVTATISYLEDDELFNAGRGAVFSAEGRNELDASIMDGSTRAAGAVAGITRTRHPILAARAVMEHSPHVMLVGEGAETFARTQNLEEVAPSYFFTERRWQQLVQYLGRNNLPVPARPEGAPPAPQSYNLEGADDHQFGTVGVVAYDSRGSIAAGTSTGGMTGKRWGRVGDSPVIGAGTYAQNGVCGVSATGSGEYFIRAGVARAICARMELNNDDAEDAANLVMREVGAMGGDGGVIVVDGNGRYAWVMNTPGMYRGQLRQGGYPLVQIFADEDD